MNLFLPRAKAAKGVKENDLCVFYPFAAFAALA